MASHHDTGYKELFSHPEFVEQLIDGFAPNKIAELMDFSTLQQHNGNYVTPLYEEKFEDVVWSVDATWQGITQRGQPRVHFRLARPHDGHRDR